LVLPIRAREHVRISLNQHVQATINGFTPRSVTLTEDRLSLAYTNEVQQLEPCGFIGIDRNLDNVTVAATDGTVQQHDLSEATRVKALYRDLRSHFRRNDVRIRHEISSKYGQKQQDRVTQVLHHASKSIVEEAKAKQYGIAMEKLTDIRKLHRRGL
jgi:transposase